MRKVKASYTLREFCKLLGVSEAWIYKVETFLGLRKWASNLSGKKSSYNYNQVSFFGKVKFLRAAQVGLFDIKKIFDLEIKIFAVVAQHFSSNGEEEFASEWHTGKISQGSGQKLRKKSNNVDYVEFYLMEGLYGGSMGVEFDKEKYARNKEGASKLDHLRDEHKALLQAAQQKASIFYKNLGKFYKNMGENLEGLNKYVGIKE